MIVFMLELNFIIVVVVLLILMVLSEEFVVFVNLVIVGCIFFSISLMVMVNVMKLMLILMVDEIYFERGWLSIFISIRKMIGINIKFFRLFINCVISFIY